MAKKNLYVATTNHGFGHTTRTAAVAATIQQLEPEIQLIISTNAPRWLLEQYIRGDFVHRTVALDIGVIQSDSLTIDKSATLKRLQEMRAAKDSIASKEIDFIKEHNVGLVLADIPPLAVNIAHGADIPCWMTSNFGWDYIYRDWGSEFHAIADWISYCYNECDHLLRIPFHEEMSAFPTISDVGLTGGVPRYSLEELKAYFRLDYPPEKIVLLTFGGDGISRIPYPRITDFPDHHFITFDPMAPELPNLRKICDRRYKPVDFMPLCNRIISKPGYSTFAEACRLGIPVTTITRDEFAESLPLLQGLKEYSYHQILTPDEFFNGDWSFMQQLMAPPRQSLNLSKNGNHDIALAIINHFSCN